MGGRGQQWPEHRNLHVDRDTEIEDAAKALGTWYARRHGSEPHQEATRGWLETGCSGRCRVAERRLAAPRQASGGLHGRRLAARGTSHESRI
jgi:hypothetical protein